MIPFPSLLFLCRRPFGNSCAHTLPPSPNDKIFSRRFAHRNASTPSQAHFRRKRPSKLLHHTVALCTSQTHSRDPRVQIRDFSGAQSLSALPNRPNDHCLVTTKSIQHYKGNHRVSYERRRKVVPWSTLSGVTTSTRPIPQLNVR